MKEIDFAKKAINHLNVKIRTKKKRDLINVKMINKETKNIRKKKKIGFIIRNTFSNI